MATEKDRRVYYQDIVYAVCSVLDEIDGNHISKNNAIVCGTVDNPSIEVQQRMDCLVLEIEEFRKVSGARVKG